MFKNRGTSLFSTHEIYNLKRRKWLEHTDGDIIGATGKLHAFIKKPQTNYVWNTHSLKNTVSTYFYFLSIISIPGRV